MTPVEIQTTELNPTQHLKDFLRRENKQEAEMGALLCYQNERSKLGQLGFSKDAFHFIWMPEKEDQQGSVKAALKPQFETPNYASGWGGEKRSPGAPKWNSHLNSGRGECQGQRSK